MNKIILEINKEMEKQGLSQTALAKKADIEQKKVNRLLSGVTKRLDLEVVGKLRGALGIAEPPEAYFKPTVIHQGLTPAEAEALRIMRECPEALAVVRMMGDVDSDTQKDILRIAEKEKLLQDMIKERIDKKTA